MISGGKFNSSAGSVNDWAGSVIGDDNVDNAAAAPPDETGDDQGGENGEVMAPDEGDVPGRIRRLVRE